MAFSAPIGSSPFAPGGGLPGQGCGINAGPGQRSGDANCPTGPILGPGSELRRLYSMPNTMGHASAVNCMAIVDDKVYSGGRDNHLFMWRGQKPGGRDFELVQDSAPIQLSSSPNCILYDAASRWMFLGLWRGDIQAFCKEPVADCRLEGHRKCVSSMTIHSSVVVSGSHDGTVRLWTANPQAGVFQACGQPMTNPSGAVNSVKVFNDGLWAGGDQGITCFDLNTLQAKGTIPSQAGVTKLLEFQGYMLAAFKNGEVRIFDASGSQTYLHPPQGEHTTNTAVELMMHPFENKPILLCGQDFGYVTAYDLPEFRPRGTFVCRNQSNITSIVDVKADGMFLTAGLHGDIMMWQWQQRQQGGVGGMPGNANVPVAANPFAPAGNVPAAGNPFAAAAPGSFPAQVGFQAPGIGGPGDLMM